MNPAKTCSLDWEQRVGWLVQLAPQSLTGLSLFYTVTLVPVVCPAIVRYDERWVALLVYSNVPYKSLNTFTRKPKIF